MPKSLRWVKYSAEDFLGGVETLSALEELAYRRICDLIYKIGGPVMLDDRKLSGFTKTGKRWRRIKVALITQGKLFEPLAGGLMNERCKTTIAEQNAFYKSQRDAARRSVVSGKSLKNLKRGPNQGNTKEHSTPNGVESARPRAREGSSFE